MKHVNVRNRRSNSIRKKDWRLNWADTNNRTIRAFFRVFANFHFPLILFSKPNIFPLFAKSILDSASSVNKVSNLETINLQDHLLMLKTVAFGENDKRTVFCRIYFLKDKVEFWLKSGWKDCWDLEAVP